LELPKIAVAHFVCTKMLARLSNIDNRRNNNINRSNGQARDNYQVSLQPPGHGENRYRHRQHQVQHRQHQHDHHRQRQQRPHHRQGQGQRRHRQLFSARNVAVLTLLVCFIVTVAWFRSRLLESWETRSDYQLESIDYTPIILEQDHQGASMIEPASKASLHRVAELHYGGVTQAVDKMAVMRTKYPECYGKIDYYCMMFEWPCRPNRREIPHNVNHEALRTFMAKAQQVVIVEAVEAGLELSQAACPHPKEFIFLSTTTLLQLQFENNCIVYKDAMMALRDSQPVFAKHQRQQDLYAITVATYRPFAFELHEYSAENAGVHLHVLGGDIGALRANGRKLPLLHEHLRTLAPQQVVVVVDAFDVFWATSNPQDMIAEFKSMNADILFSAERMCFPDARFAPLYPESDTVYRHLNSGGIMAYAGALLWLLDHHVYEEFASNSDQRFYTRVFLQLSQTNCGPTVRLDTHARIFQNIDPYWITSIRSWPGSSTVHNMQTHTTPSVLHFPGFVNKLQFPLFFLWVWMPLVLGVVWFCSVTTCFYSWKCVRGCGRM
jgi:hypothetical protein